MYAVLKLGWYQFKVEWYKFRVLAIIPMVTTKKMTKNYTGKEMKKNQNGIREKLIKTNEGNTGGTEEQKWYRRHVENKQQNVKTKSYIISINFKSKWIKFTS